MPGFDRAWFKFLAWPRVSDLESLDLEPKFLALALALIP